MTTHLMALSSPQLQEGKCWKGFLFDITHLGFLPPGNLEVVATAHQITYIFHISFSWKQPGFWGTDTPTGISTES